MRPQNAVMSHLLPRLAVGLSAEAGDKRAWFTKLVCDTVWALLNAFACLHCNRYEAIHEQLKELADAHQAGANTAEAATKHREDLEASLQPVDKMKKRQRLYASTYDPHRC